MNAGYNEPTKVMHEVASYFGFEHSPTLRLDVSVVDSKGSRVVSPIHAVNDAQGLLRVIYPDFNIASIEGVEFDDSGLCIQRTPIRFWNRKPISIEEITSRLHSDPRYDLARRTTPRDAQSELRTIYALIQQQPITSTKGQRAVILLGKVIGENVDQAYERVHARNQQTF